jgi:hypothetical protein
MTSEQCFAKANEMDALAVRYPQLSGEYLELARTWRTSGRALALDENIDSYFPPVAQSLLDRVWRKSE